MENTVEIGLYLSYFMFAIAAIGAIVLPLVNSMSQPKKLVNGLIAIGALLVVFLISWGIAGDELRTLYIDAESPIATAGMSKLVGGTITMVYVLMGIAVVGIVYTEITKAIK